MIDLAAMGVAVLGLVLGANGQPTMGGVLYAGGLTALPVAIARRGKSWTLLPFSFASHFVVMIACLLGAAILKDRAPASSIGCLACFVYYFGCVSLVERKARYVPWGAGWSWRTVTADEHPRIYRACIATVFVLAGSLLALLFASVAGLLTVADRGVGP